jgi:hypothetical protein
MQKKRHQKSHAWAPLNQLIQTLMPAVLYLCLNLPIFNDLNVEEINKSCIFSELQSQSDDKALKKHSCVYFYKFMPI